MRAPGPEHLSKVVTAGVKALVDDAKRLGITWDLNFATTIDSESSNFQFTVLMDGDDTNIAVVSLMGIVPNGARVAVLSLPTGANYAFAMAGGNPLSNCDGINETFGAATTTSASYADMNSSALSFEKVSSASRLRVDMSLALFSTIASTKAQFGVSIAGTDYDVCNIFISPANSIMSTSGTAFIDGIDAGSLTIQPRWLRSSGTGTLTTTSAESITMAVCETN